MVFIMKKFISSAKKNVMKSLVSPLLLLCGLFLATQAMASFKLESASVIYNEGTARKAFNIKNTSAAPMLMVTKIEDLDGNDFSKNILISPPITRIDPEQSQQINFMLKKDVQLDHEVLLKVSFEGVAEKAQNSASMPVRQSIGFLLQPASLPVVKKPWEALTLKKQGGQLWVTNPSKHVVRLAPQMKMIPSGEIVSFGKFYIMSGETLKLDIKSQPEAVTLYPLSRYGLKLPEENIALK